MHKPFVKKCGKIWVVLQFSKPPQYAVTWHLAWNYAWQIIRENHAK